MKNGSDIGAVFVSCAHNFQAEDSQTRPRLLFCFQSGVVATIGNAAWIIRSSELQVSAPIIQLHSPADTDTLD